MKQKLFTLLVFVVVPLFVYAQDLLLDVNVSDEPLEELLMDLEKEHGFLFSYKEATVKDIRITAAVRRQPIQKLLTSILRGTGLQFEMVDQKYILLFRPMESTPPTLAVELCGRVIDQMTGEPLPGANVYLLKGKQGTPTALDGSFRFEAILGDGDSVMVSYVGYKNNRFLAAEFMGPPCPVVAMKYYDFGKDLVVVTEYLTDGIQLEDNGAATTLRPRQIGTMPGQVEPEVMNTIQFLPGVTSPDESAGGMSVRGGNTDQNLILWEDIPVYHAAHYFGTISAFNPYLINKISVYRGGFSAQYGGRISSVIDLRSTDPTLVKPKMEAGLNFLNAYVNGQVPLAQNKLSVVYSVRRSFSEWWRTPAFDNLTRRIHQAVLFQTPTQRSIPEGVTIRDHFSFWDANAKATYRFSERDKITAAWCYASNDFESQIVNDIRDQTQSDTLFLENNGLSLAWQHQWSPSFSTRLLSVYTKFHYDYEYRVESEGVNGPDKNGNKTSKIEEGQLHLSNNYLTKKGHTLNFGYQLTSYDVEFQIDKAAKSHSHADVRENVDTKLHVLYASFNTAKEKRWGADIGLRNSYFKRRNGFFWEPRLRLWYHFSKHWSGYVNAGRYYQFLSQLIELEGDRASIETPVWAVAGEREVPVLNAFQYQLGVLWHRKSWLVDVQAYAKSINGLTSLSTGFNEDLTERYHIGKARIRGVDVLLKNRWGSYQAWVSYSLAKVDHHFKTFFDEDFSAPNDQRHVFRVASRYTLANWGFSLGWKMATGRPYSLLENYEVEVEQNGMQPPRETIRPVEKAFNTERLPLTHQMDISIRYQFYPKWGDRWKGEMGLSLLNVYDHNNLYERSFLIDNRPGMTPTLTYTDRAALGFTPNLTVRLVW